MNTERTVIPRRIRWRGRAIVVAAIALFVALGSAGAVPAANSSSYQDSVGEEPGAPDIANATVSNDDQGLISFEIRFANRDVLGPLEELSIWLDRDARADTGLFGYDDFIEVRPSETDFLRLDDFLFEPSTLSAVAGPSTITVRINVSDLSNTRRFNLVVMADANPDDMNAPVDFAPDRPPGWSYDVKLYVAPVLELSQITVKPNPARAGKLLTGRSTLTLTRAGVAEPLTSGAKVTWTATVGTLRLKPRSTASTSNGLLSSTWTVPKDAKGKRVKIKLAVTLENVTVTKTYVQRIG